MSGSRRMVNLNSASIDQLQTLPGVDLRTACGLLLWRPFLTWKEVADAPGFDPGRAETLKAAGARVGLPREPSGEPSSAMDVFPLG